MMTEVVLHERPDEVVRVVVAVVTTELRTIMRWTHKRALIALGLGARAVFIGRPVLWGLSFDGERGASSVLALLNEELLRAMQLDGCANADAVRDGVIRRR